MKHASITRRDAIRNTLAEVRQRTGTAWFHLWILFGLALAILLLLNSISNYVVVSRRFLVEQVRRDVASIAASADRQVMGVSWQNAARLSTILDQVRQSANGRIAWIQVRDGDGKLLGQSGPAGNPVFSPEQVRTQMQKRQPLFKTVTGKSGRVVVEAFPFRLPSPAAPAVLQVVSDQGEKRPARRFAILEVGAFLDGAGGGFWPLRRNLLINSSAAIVLLISLIVVALRFRPYLEGRKLEQQVAIARTVQRDLLPTATTANGDFELAADCLPAAHVGGDFYDSFKEGRRSALVLGDVSGKGIPAALLMGVIHGAVRSSPWTGSRAAHEETMRHLNQLLCERASSARYATMFSAYLDPTTSRLHYINAGHFPPLLFRAASPDQPVRLTSGGPVLGMLNACTYQQDSVRLAPGDVLVIYSDGVIESSRGDDDLFGEDRLTATVRNSLHLSAAGIRDSVLAALGTFSGDRAPDDDRTLVVVRYPGGAAVEPWPDVTSALSEVLATQAA